MLFFISTGFFFGRNFDKKLIRIILCIVSAALGESDAFSLREKYATIYSKCFSIEKQATRGQSPARLERRRRRAGDFDASRARARHFRGVREDAGTGRDAALPVGRRQAHPHRVRGVRRAHRRGKLAAAAAAEEIVHACG